MSPVPGYMKGVTLRVTPSLVSLSSLPCAPRSLSLRARNPSPFLRPARGRRPLAWPAWAALGPRPPGGAHAAVKKRGRKGVASAGLASPPPDLPPRPRRRRAPGRRAAPPRVPPLRRPRQRPGTPPACPSPARSEETEGGHVKKKQFTFTHHSPLTKKLSLSSPFHLPSRPHARRVLQLAAGLALHRQRQLGRHQLAHRLLQGF